MPRKLPVQYAGAIHHVMSRGRREDIYLDDVDRLKKAENRSEWRESG
jgi:hypothetical protein